MKPNFEPFWKTKKPHCCCLSDLSSFCYPLSSSTSPLIDQMIAKSKQAMVLWLEGFREACSLHRVVILCHRFVHLISI